MPGLGTTPSVSPLLGVCRAAQTEVEEPASINFSLSIIFFVKSHVFIAENQVIKKKFIFSGQSQHLIANKSAMMEIVEQEMSPEVRKHQPRCMNKPLGSCSSIVEQSTCAHNSLLLCMSASLPTLLPDLWWHLDEISHLEKRRDVHLPSLMQGTGPGAVWHCQMPGARQESSDLLLSPGDFCSVFAELQFQAGQEVVCFPNDTPMAGAPASRHARGRVAAAI